MKGDAIKHVAATAVAGIEPTDQEVAAALGEAVDLLLGFFAAVDRIAYAADKLAGAVDKGELNVYARNADA